MSRSILLIDDDAEVLTLLGRFFEQQEWVVFRASEPTVAATIYDRERPDLVLLDLDLPGMSGLRLLDILRTRDADATILMLTGHADVPTAVEAMRLGAENFLTKPVELGHLEAAVERAFEKVELRRRNRYFAERQAPERGLEVLGRSPIMREIGRQIELLARTDGTVLLTGETGTGKGWVAQTLHSMSARAESPFVEINCAGLSATFLDSELFGHEKGAFTDAKQRKLGLLEVADSGTVFLDEIGDLVPSLQPKLLKVLETRRFRRLGGTREIDVDVRVITATNHDLEAAVRAGQFREDLYYRLAVFPLRLPPLRERSREDIADLALSLLATQRRQTGRGPTRLSADALDRLLRYAWPGNIRELRNLLERVALLTDDDVLLPVHLPIEFSGSAALPGHEPTLTLESIERRHIAHVLGRMGGNRSRTARALGISRATLYEKLARYKLADIGTTRSNRPTRSA